MRKITMILLIMALVLSACGGESTVSEEDLKAQIRAEIEAENQLKEALEAEIRAEIEAEAEAEAEENAASEEVSTEPVGDEEENVEVIDEEQEVEVIMNQDFENGVSYQGSVACNTAPYFIIMYNEYENVVVDGKEYDTIAFGSDIISKYLDRSVFTYHFEGFPMVDDTTYMAIEFDPETTYEAMGYLWVEDYKVVEDPFGMGAMLTDHSNDPYPLSYYQDVIKTLCLGMYGSSEDDIRDNEGYTQSVDFKDAVDRVLSKGYELKRNGGYYIVTNEEAYNIDRKVSVDELCQIVGISIEDVVVVDSGGYTLYFSEFKNDEIAFYVYHDEPISGDMTVANIYVTGYDYKLFGVGLGERVQDAYEELSFNYEGMYSHHSDTRSDYVYDADGYGVALNNYGWNDTDINIDEAMIVRKVSAVIPFDI